MNVPINPYNKFAEVTQWLKTHVCILFVIFPGDSNLHSFAVEAGLTQALHG